MIAQIKKPGRIQNKAKDLAELIVAKGKIHLIMLTLNLVSGVAQLYIFSYTNAKKMFCCFSISIC